MARWDDVEDDEAGNRDDPLPQDMEAGQEPAATPCPQCGGAVWDDLELCTHCGHWLTEEGQPRRGWLWLAGAGLLAIMAWTLTRASVS